MYIKLTKPKGIVNHYACKLWLIMRLTTLILITSLIHANASSFAQRINLSEKNVPIQKVLQVIRTQTGYDFVYNAELLSRLSPIDIRLQNATLEEALKACLSGKNLSYVIDNKSVIITRNTTSIKPVIVRKDQINVKGRVVDKDGVGLSGATIAVKGGRLSTTSGANGNFVLMGTEEGAILAISYIGYQTREVLATADLGIIVLEQSAGELKEVAVTFNTGYQKINARRSPGAIVSVSSEELEKRNTVNILDNLEGSVPGLVRYRGATTIRGTSTIRANSGILVVVDGLPIEGSLEDINPYDVENVTVLKDAAAASIYGARATNGVIVVTTKRAKQIGKTTIDFSTNFTFSDKPDYSYRNEMSPSQQVDWELDYYKWWFSGSGGGGDEPLANFETRFSDLRAIKPVAYAYYRFLKNPATFSQSQLDAELNQLKSNNFAQEYKDHALLNRLIQQYNFAVRTNNGKSQSSLVVNYTPDNEGYINRYNRKLNLFYKGNYAVAPWLDLEYGVNSVIGKSRRQGDSSSIDPFNVPAYYKLRNSDGSLPQYPLIGSNPYLTTLQQPDLPLYSFGFNHIEALGRDMVNTSTLNTRYYVNLNFKVLPGLTINPMFQYEDNRSEFSGYSEEDSYTMRRLHNIYTERTDAAGGGFEYNRLLPQGGRLKTGTTRSPNYTARGQANYNKKFGAHLIEAIAGTEFRETRIYGSRNVLYGYSDDLQTQNTENMDYRQLRNYTSSWIDPNYSIRSFDFEELTEPIGLDVDTRHRYASVYANLSYSFNDRYTAFGSIRKDYADLFGGDDKFRGSPLWSVGSSWIISEEKFMEKLPQINFLKLRASYGLTGNIEGNTSALLAASTSTNPVTGLPVASITTPPNPQLRWEKTATINAGLDFYVFNNRLRGAFDWYNRKGTDLFAQKRLDPSEGFSSMVINNASMVNNGVELSLSYDWFRSSQPRGFDFSSNVVITRNTNRITYIDDVITDPYTFSVEGLKLGDPMNAIYSYRYGGLNDVGSPQFYNENNVLTTDRMTNVQALVYSGGRDPRTNIAFNNELSYKGFNLSVFAVYYGGHFFRATPFFAYEGADGEYSPMPSYLLNSWTPTNTNTNVPASGQHYTFEGAVASSMNAGADYLVRSADFIKIRNIVLGYDLPRGFASKIRANNVKLRFQVNNPKHLWIKQKDYHLDPETGGAPLVTSYVLGLNVNF